MLRPAAALAAALLALAAPALGAPKVVASIKPVHSLVAGVMAGVGEPALLVGGNASPHNYAMRPADAKALAAADLVFWVGPELEGFLEKPIMRARKGAAVTLLGLDGLTLLPLREGGLFEAGDHGHGHGHGHGDHAGEPGDVDGHIWLDPDNARRIVAAAAERLAAVDPANAAAYAANAARMDERIAALDAELAARLAPLKGRPFVVFHDAYHYFEAHYGVEAAGAITVNPERPPGAKRLKAIHDKLAATAAACVFAEPQFEPKLVQSVLAGTAARSGTLDPEGARLKDGPDLYFGLMRDLADSLSGCLNKAG
ncbi:MAG TPA: zinc ABC transporter substrate-binding protein [Alphaproteobacteria bacterium]|nr:zinc ABC transporter substrate-binding protein [Alphaproteobacteria bacterium]